MNKQKLLKTKKDQKRKNRQIKKDMNKALKEFYGISLYKKLFKTK